MAYNKTNAIFPQNHCPINVFLIKMNKRKPKERIMYSYFSSSRVILFRHVKVIKPGVEVSQCVLVRLFHNAKHAIVVRKFMYY